MTAAELKARFPIAYADAFAAATGKHLDVPVVTGDPEFRRVEGEGKLLWRAGARPSARSARSKTCGRPSNSRTSLPSAACAAPVGVEKPGSPAPPARTRSISVPCGTISSPISPSRTWSPIGVWKLGLAT